MFRGGGLLGAGLAAGSVFGHADPAQAHDHDDRPQAAGYRWLAGDHHVHTLYSNDGKDRVGDQVRQAHRYGLDWMVITDHGNANHSKIGVEKVNPDIRAGAGLRRVRCAGSASTSCR